jgi:hypothetical protein
MQNKQRMVELLGWAILFSIVTCIAIKLQIVLLQF